MLEIKNVSKKFGFKEALSDINLSIDRGHIVGLFGANGAGKTVLMKCIMGYLNHEGSITLDGEKITCKNVDKISFGTCEHSFFPRLTALEHREFLKEQFPKFNEKRFDVLMEFFNLPPKRKLRFLSTGQKNQFETIMALSQGADYIILDEPFSGNDLLNREDLYKLIIGLLEPNETIIMSTHLIEEIKGFVDMAILIKDGKIIENVSVEELNEQGVDLTDFIRTSYGYDANRVIRALESINGRDE
ncbi:MAG: ABC transporter ATP-binding protein [Lachnospiraceae bacterium]|nr:ABC transporter ATP-binding protein [Lachnospiraceae bacterium]